MSNPTKQIGAVVTARMRASGISESRAALESGISRQTLRRRLASGAFTTPELLSIAAVLDVPASVLLAQAEAAA